MEDEYLKVEDLEIGAVYRLEARNFEIGMWDGESFWGPRVKFGRTYIDKEIHWDIDDRFGTAKPLELLVSPSNYV